MESTKGLRKQSFSFCNHFFNLLFLFFCVLSHKTNALSQKFYTLSRNPLIVQGPRTTVRIPGNVKMPSKAHKNNVNSKAILRQKRRIYGLFQRSMPISAGEGDTIRFQDYRSSILSLKYI